MTDKRKLEILWDLYFIAVGLDTLMTREEIINYNESLFFGDYQMPSGFCYALDICFRIVPIEQTYNYK